MIVAESSQFTYKNIDFKLKKLQEHINIIKKSDSNNYSTNNSNSSNSYNNYNNEFQKDISNITLLHQYILDAISVSKIDPKSIAELKKILTNIDVKYLILILILKDSHDYS